MYACTWTRRFPVASTAAANLLLTVSRSQTPIVQGSGFSSRYARCVGSVSVPRESNGHSPNTAVRREHPLHKQLVGCTAGTQRAGHGAGKRADPGGGNQRDLHVHYPERTRDLERDLLRPLREA